MKNFFKRYAMTLVALGIASGTLMSFELNKASNTWHYDEQVPGDYTNPRNWTPGVAPAETCVAGGTKPCEINIEASNTAELSEFMEDKDNQEILNLNVSSRRF